MSQEVLIALIGALLPLAATTTLAWFERRGRENRRSRMITAAQQHVEFLNTYFTTRSQMLPAEQVAEFKSITAAAAERIFRELQEDLHEIEEPIRAAQGRSLFQRIFLLYAMNTRAARVFRLLFWVFLVLSVVFSSLFAAGFSRATAESSSVLLLLGFAILLLPLVVPALVFRSLAIQRDRA